MSQCNLFASIGFEASVPGTVPGTCSALNQCLQNRILGGAGVHRERSVRGARAARGPRGRAPPLRARAAPPPARAAPTPRAAAGRGRRRRSQRRPRLAAPARLRVTDPRSRRGEVRSGARHTRDRVRSGRWPGDPPLECATASRPTLPSGGLSSRPAVPFAARRSRIPCVRLLPAPLRIP